MEQLNLQSAIDKSRAAMLDAKLRLNQQGAADKKGIDEMMSAKTEDWYYLILKLAQLIRRGNRIGQAAWSFQPRQVRDLHYGYVWGHGGHEQETELPTSGSVADIMAAGSQWWPVIWVYNDGVKVPVYCRGLAWMNARPWYAHRTRLQEVETPGVITEEWSY